nr:hypothetical protein [uncultured Lachnoclostridium sp.]
MKNTTLDDKQVKELADYAAKRCASRNAPGMTTDFIEEYMREYDKAYATIKSLNKRES